VIFEPLRQVRFEKTHGNRNFGFDLLASVRFLSRVGTLMLTRDIDIAILSVRLSIHDTLVLYENSLTYCYIFSQYGSPIIRVLPASNIFMKFRRGQRWDMKMLQFSTNNLLYLRNGWRYMGICSEAFYKHWILFTTVWHLSRLSQGHTQGESKMC